VFSALAGCWRLLDETTRRREARKRMTIGWMAMNTHPHSWMPMSGAVTVIVAVVVESSVAVDLTVATVLAVTVAVGAPLGRCRHPNGRQHTEVQRHDGWCRGAVCSTANSAGLLGSSLLEGGAEMAAGVTVAETGSAFAGGSCPARRCERPPIRCRYLG
jgi:hypothetical protein